MATVAADKAEVSENLDGKERDEYYENIKDDLMGDLAQKLHKDPKMIKKIPQYLADKSLIEDMKK